MAGGQLTRSLVSTLPHVSVGGLDLGRALRHDTGERFDGSGNAHNYVAVTDGTDIERALKTLHQRFWLVGLGYYVVGTAGSLLEHSIIDVTVYGPERLVFEGAPYLSHHLPKMRRCGGRKPLPGRSSIPPKPFRH